MADYLVIWRPHSATDFYSTAVSLPSDCDPHSLSVREWLDHARNTEAEVVYKNLNLDSQDPAWDEIRASWFEEDAEFIQASDLPTTIYYPEDN
jgi:hypothetical protein